MTDQQLKNIVEAALLAAGRPLRLEQLQELFAEHERPGRDAVRAALDVLAREYQPRGLEITEVAGGFRVQIKADLEPWIARLWEERPARYSRALLETLALIAYRQPITRGEIEDIRGVAVSTNIIKTLMEREWVRVVGYREVPGRPALYGTTREFLDHFNLKSLDELPALSELREIDGVNMELPLASSEHGQDAETTPDGEEPRWMDPPQDVPETQGRTAAVAPESTHHDS